MTTNAAIGSGTFFRLHDGTQLVEIAEVLDVTPPNEQADVIGATHMQSPPGYKEFILGLTDPGEAGFDMNFLPGSASETLILTAKAGKLARLAQIEFPNGIQWDFDYLVTGYAPAVPVEGKMTCRVNGKVTGAVDRD